MHIILKKIQEKIDVLNQADSLIFQTEKSEEKERIK